MKNRLFTFLHTSPGVFLRWLFLSVLTGLVAGAAGVLFHFVLEWCTETRSAHDALLYFLPLAGAAIALLYRFGDHSSRRGTNSVLAAIRSDERVSFRTAPLIFIGTALTHLFGGSAGREGAALQLGGAIASTAGDLFHLDEKDRHIIVMCGSAAAFSALFGTPVTAAIFPMEVVSVGVMYYAAIIPCVLSSLTASFLAQLCGVAPTSFALPAVCASTPMTLLQVLVLGALCAVLARLFCFAMHRASAFFSTLLPNTVARAAVGGCVIVLLTLLLHTRDYNGAGMDIVSAALLYGTAVPYAFLLKLLFTAITLGSGFKGGEIVPTFFIGATFGCIAGALLGLPASFGAAIGLVALFCGVTNCPIASILLSIELFGAEALPLFSAAAAVSYMLSGYSGLYSEQRILHSKLRAESISAHL